MRERARKPAAFASWGKENLEGVLRHGRQLPGKRGINRATGSADWRAEKRDVALT